MKPETRMQEVERAKNRQRVLELRVKGLSYEAIEQETGIPSSTAHNHVQHYFKVIGKLCEELADEAKALELRRLDTWLAAINDQIEKAGSSVTVDEETGKAYFDLDLSKLITTGIKLSERRAKLLGLDAPAKVEHRELPAIAPADDARAVREKLVAALAEVDEQIAAEETRH